MSDTNIKVLRYLCNNVTAIAFVHHNKFLTEFHIIKHPIEFEKLLILSTVIFVIITVLEQSGARHLLNISFPDDTVSRRV